MLFVILSSAFVLFFDHFEDSHDIDNAVDAATGHFLRGGNPYADEVVPRFPEIYHGSARMLVNGTYNYLPLDLLIYSGMKQVFSFLGTPYWFIAANGIFAAIAGFFYWRMTRLNPLILFPVAASIFIVFSFDNVCLTSVFILAGMMLFYKPERTGNEMLLALLLFGLASLTKILAVVVLATFILVYAQLAIRGRSKGFASLTAVYCMGMLGIALAIIAPFGVNNVIDSTIFFHADPALRIDTAMGGTPLYHLLGESGLFLPVFIGATAVALALSLRFGDILDRILFVEMIFLMILITASHSALVIPAILLSLGFVSQRIAFKELLEELRGGRKILPKNGK